MSPAVIAGLLAGLLGTSGSSAPVDHPLPLWQIQSAAPNAERIESGQIHAPGGATLEWRIRLLPLASFPDLPSPVAAQLARRRCMIPQTFEAQKPENVVHGAFLEAGSSDWAVLCSASGETTLYVFLSGTLDAPIALRTQSDTAWLGAEPGSSLYGSAWGIAVRSAADLYNSRQIHDAVRAIPFDHDGIEDSHLELSATVHYYHAGQWLNLSGHQ